MSVSVIFAAYIVTVIVSLGTKLASGSNTKLFPPPLTVAVIFPLNDPVILNHGAVTFTFSLNVISMFASTEIFPSLLPGMVVITEGSPPLLKVCPVLIAPKVLGAGEFQIKSS